MPPTRFTATPAAPAGWTVTASASSLDLAAGGSATVTYSVAAPASALAGSYGLTVRVADGISPVHEVTASGNFVVETLDTSSPTIPASVTAAAKRGQVNVSWRPSTDNTGVAGYRIWRNGAIVATSRWNDVGGPDGCRRSDVYLPGRCLRCRRQRISGQQRCDDQARRGRQGEVVGVGAKHPRPAA